MLAVKLALFSILVFVFYPHSHLYGKASPSCPSRPVFGRPKALGGGDSGIDFFRFLVDFDTLRTPEIIEKQTENLGFCMIFIFSAKSLPNQKKVALGCARTLKMEARGAQNHPQRHQNDSRELQDEAQERQDGPSECPNGCPDGPWQPNLLLKVLPKANLSAPGSLRD